MRDSYYYTIRFILDHMRRISPRRHPHHHRHLSIPTQLTIVFALAVVMVSLHFLMMREVNLALCK